MYFPWVGLLEQIRLADVFVHYDDVQLARGFCNRVQVKTATGTRWITVPVRNRHRGLRIDEAVLDEASDWRGTHRAVLRQAYHNAPYREDMLAIVDHVFAQEAHTLADVSRASLLALADYFDIAPAQGYADSSALGIGGRSSQRLLDIVARTGGNEYITGHGARQYLDHTLFEASGVTVSYMHYRCEPWSQLHGPFTPYVSALDLVANCGPAGASRICSGTEPWRSVVPVPA
jgi:hypothetical protein